MDIRKIKKLIELVEESGIAELEISEGEESVRISRNFSGQVTAAPQMIMQQAAAPVAAPAAALIRRDTPDHGSLRAFNANHERRAEMRKHRSTSERPQLSLLACRS